MRRYFFNLTLNTRDIGGYKTLDGHYIKYGIIIRSDGLRFISEEDKLFLLKNNIKTQIDLRTEDIKNRYPSLLENDSRFNYYLIPLKEGSLASLQNIEIYDLYMKMIDNKEVFYKVFKLISDVEGGLIYTCTAGKDRTGMVTYLLLSLLGVDEEDIIKDYEASTTYILERLPIVRKEKPEFPKFLGDSKREYIETFNKLFKDKYHSAYDYLISIGITDEEINKIRSKLLD